MNSFFTSKLIGIVKLSLIISVGYCMFVPQTAWSQEYDKTKVKQTELEHLTGLYTGQLQYKDYGDGQITTIKLIGNVYFKNDALIIETVINERGKIYRSSKKLKIKNGQIHYGGKTKLHSKHIDFDAQIMELEFARKGKDNKKSVDLKFEFVAGLDNIKLSKWVKPKGSEDYFKRNEYSFKRY